MSGPGKSAKPVRQLSLQPPVPRRQQIRRQRSADDDKSLQICASPLARGKRGTSGKAGFERPKVRVAWSENRRQNENKLEQVEVVAVQIPGRSRPVTGRSRGFVGIDKPTILYSRQELAERLRLAWKQREENKANISIFLAHGTLGARCDSEMSGQATVTAPPSPLPKDASSKPETLLDNDRSITEGEETQRSGSHIHLNDNYMETGTESDVIKKPTIVSLENGDKNTPKRDSDLTSGFEHSFCETREIDALGKKVVSDAVRKRREDIDVENEKGEVCSPFNAPLVKLMFKGESYSLGQEHSEIGDFFFKKLISRSSNDCSLNAKKKSSVTIDRPPQASSAALPSIKSEHSCMTKTAREDLSSAKQKRASFHSGTNRAFLGPIRSAAEFKWNPAAEKGAQQKLATEAKPASERNVARGNPESKDNAGNRTVAPKCISDTRYGSTAERIAAQKTITDPKASATIERNARGRTAIESKDASLDSRTTAQKTSDSGRVPSTMKRTASASIVAENKNGPVADKAAPARVVAPELRCSSVNERNSPLKKMMETQRVDQKSRRTNSAPPQRHLGSSSSRVQVSIVIDAPSTPASGESNDKEEQGVGCRDNAVGRIDATSIKNQVSSGRSARSAQWKRRSRSARRRFWGKQDENGKSRNHGRSSIDSRTIDIVTMVSLISSAESDSDTENSPGDDKLIDELRSKLPTTSIIKPSMNPAVTIARKPIKSVSFQRDSSDEDPPKEQQPPPKEEKKATPGRLAIVNQRGNGGTLSGEEAVLWRTDIPSLALPVLALIHDAEEVVDVPLTDREKRCLAVPIGDLHDKRKLLKTRSTPSRSLTEKQTMSPKPKIQEPPATVHQKVETSTQQLKTPANNTAANVKQGFLRTAKETVQQVQPMPTEPQFQTNKEKECWHLYRKMCDKGVSVSFDTVLRGMLTPTEYRLRQRELFQDL
ncbi:uncharacterized protein LOC143371550 [Andrena cerasifolii]|uniref:uncharacterized protein LOC143371550 n=1 Tax=Andrena cerasifolii TaxID=2819439 RepID=UPI0040381531